MSELVTKLETITPAKAAKMLEHNTTNRTVRKSWVDLLARIIQDGRWRTTHQGIAFNCDGTLIDGQHRLMAIVKAGMPVKVMVTRGQDRDSIYAIDQGKGRTVVDVAGPVLGHDYGINKHHTACARAMFDAMSDLSQRINGGKTKTAEDWITYILQHREPIEFAVSHITTTPHKHSVIRGVVARAWYTVDRVRLAEFCTVFVSNVGQSKADSGALLLARYFLPSASMFSNGPARRELYVRAEAAIKAFLDRKPLTMLRPVETEQFPIPGEED